MSRWLCILGLAFATVSVADPVTRREKRAYQEQHDAATQELIIHNEFSTTLILRGTLLTPDFRDDMADYRFKLLDPTLDNHASFQARMADDAAAYHEVVFSADSAAPSKMLFGPGDDRWNIRLTADGTPQELVTVYRVRNPTPLHHGLYLQHNRWSKLYIARFHRTVESPSTVVMHVGSGHGNGDLVWQTSP